MQVKLGLFTKNFAPNTINWKSQSSLNDQFGVWKIGKQNIFVKRFQKPPSGWRLMEEAITKSFLNTPQVYRLQKNDDFYYVFLEYLDGDTLYNIIQERKLADYFQNASLSSEDKINIVLSVAASVRSLNLRNFWYPDLDLKNIFVVKNPKKTKVFLIDLDSCPGDSQPFDPGNVSQVCWEGLVKTYLKHGKSFLKREGPNAVRIIPNGIHLNQSMLILFAHYIKRLGLVPKKLPLYDPLINPQSPFSGRLSLMHLKLLDEEDCWREAEAFICNYLSIPLSRLQKKYRGKQPGKTHWIELIRNLNKERIKLDL
jgi:hypothetical protein